MNADLKFTTIPPKLARVDRLISRTEAGDATNGDTEPMYDKEILARLRKMDSLALRPELISRRTPSQNLSRTGMQRTPTPASIYAVDDAEDLTELYGLILAAAGYRVRTFNHRERALAALREDANKPALLITDYFSHSMHIDLFLPACRMAHPDLRIVLVSGIPHADARLSGVNFDHFIGKPFTPDELVEELRTVLAG